MPVPSPQQPLSAWGGTTTALGSVSFFGRDHGKVKTGSGIFFSKSSVNGDLVITSSTILQQKSTAAKKQPCFEFPS